MCVAAIVARKRKGRRVFNLRYDCRVVLNDSLPLPRKPCGTATGWALTVLSACLAGMLAGAVSGAEIEQRGQEDWPTANHFRIRYASEAPARQPVLLESKFPSDFDPDSVRVLKEGSAEIIPAKVDWRAGTARISWISTGAASLLRLLRRARPRRDRAPRCAGHGRAPATASATDEPASSGRLAVGLWAHPVALDFDGDGAMDLIVVVPGPSLQRHLPVPQSRHQRGAALRSRRVARPRARRTSWPPISTATARSTWSSAAATTATCARTASRSS